MDLEIKHIYSTDFDSYPEDTHRFNSSLYVEIGEKGKDGAEAFRFVVASPQGLDLEVTSGEFKLLRGYILMAEFDWKLIYRAIENIINHTRSLTTWNEVIRYFNRYGIYDSEDLDGKFYP
ncbi:MAG TPA: Imm8 family immunity protein [Pyrinomonadaceae bacterium]|nr:Imm8 family immunity protein [Pyrinomonadaceae bacterium]